MKLSFLSKLIPSLAFVSLSISSSVAVDVGFGFDQVEACEGDEVTVIWQGYHNLQETVGSDCNSGDLNAEIEDFLNFDDRRTYTNDELTASVGETRYFKCSAHCAESYNRFEVSCQVPPPTRAPSPFVCANDRKYKLKQNNKGCTWIGSRKKRRKNFCSKYKAVRKRCPVTCGVCCEDDTTFKFKLNNGQQKGCAWINPKKKNRMKYCKKPFISSSCPIKCEDCKTLVDPN